MTADVNSAAAACPHPKRATTPAKGCPADHSASKNCSHEVSSGFTAEMMRVASSASGFTAVQLSQARAVSSIPKGDYTPEHQSGSNEKNWEYPSEEMYFKAMQRKGWAPTAEQMKTIVAIHNTVNEQSWQEVLKWENFHP